MVKKEALKNNSGFLIHLKKYYIVYLIVILLLVLFFSYFNLYVKFKPGDIVYAKNMPSKIGEVTAISLSSQSYIVLWIDKSVTEEKASDIAKIEELSEANLSKINRTKTNQTPPVFQSQAHNDKISNFTDYVFEQAKESDNVLGIFYKGFSLSMTLGGSGCKPAPICGDWGNCLLDYNLEEVVLGSNFSGIQYSSCVDNNGCLPSIIDSRPCDLKQNITVKKVNLCGVEQYELIDESGEVVAKIKNNNKTNYADVRLNLAGNSEC